VVECRCYDRPIETGIAEHHKIIRRCNAPSPEQFPVICGPQGFKHFPVQPDFGTYRPDIQDNATIEFPAIGLPDYIRRLVP
jgi:hypothetical protein